MKIEWERFPQATHFTKSRAHGIAFWEMDGAQVVNCWVSTDTLNGVPQFRCITGANNIGIPSNWPVVHERPVVEPWDGEGLPHAGVRCEYSLSNGKIWHECTIKYVLAGGKQLVAECSGNPTDKESVLHVNTCQFRTLRTAEQIVADERLEAINWMEIDAGMCATAFDGDPEARRWVENLIDKGWRKGAV